VRWACSGALGFLWALLNGQAVWADWTPMISSGAFTGIQVDVGACAAGIIAVCLIVIGLALLIRVLSH
jgi:hypothetical protein